MPLLTLLGEEQNRAKLGQGKGRLTALTGLGLVLEVGVKLEESSK